MAEIPINRGPQDATQPPMAEEFRTDQVSAPQIEIAQRAFEQFLNGLSEVVPGYLLTPAEIRLAGTEQQLLSVALASGESGSCAIWFTLPPFPYRICLELGGSFVGAALESVLGAPSDAAGSSRESFTDVDLHVLRELFELVGAELQKAWLATSGDALEMGSIAISSTADASQADDPGMVLLSAEVTMRGSSSAIRLLIPSFLLRLAAARQIDAATKGVDPCAALGQALDTASVDVDAVLDGARIQFRDLLALQPGRILQLPHRTTAAIECHVNGITKFRGELVSNDKTLGFQIQ
jgi:flagellar motor switch protein FliM